MSLLQETREILKKNRLFPLVESGQHFCVDEKVLAALLQEAEITREDVILEIGTGLGALTRELARQAKTVISIEKDRRLQTLISMPENVEVIWDDARKILRRRKDFNKIVANIPYQIAEPLLQYLCTAPHVKLAVITVPESFARKAPQNIFFSAFLHLEATHPISPQAFFPPPRTHSSLLKITPRKNIDSAAFLCQQLFLQRDKKLGNSLRESLIALAKWEGKVLSKKEAVRKLQELHLSASLLQERVQRVALHHLWKIVSSAHNL